MKKINLPMFIVCLIGVLFLTGSIITISVLPLNIFTDYSYTNIVNNDTIEEYIYEFGSKYLVIDYNSETYVEDGEDIEIENVVRYRYKLKNGSVYIDANSMQTWGDKTGWSEIASSERAWTLFLKSDKVNAYYLDVDGHKDLAYNYEAIGAVVIMAILDIIFLVKMIGALKRKTSEEIKEVKPIIRYNETTGEPYEVTPTRYNPVTGEPEYTAINKSMLAYGLFGIFLGFVGAQQFYGRKYVKGIFSALFFWTGVPFFIGLMTGIFALCTPQKEFERKYIKS